MCFLGIDLGTSGLRALLIDGDGTPIGDAERSYETHRPQPGWSEQSPQDWVDALDAVMAELAGQFQEFGNIKGIGVSGHMHGAVALDNWGAVLRPCIMWNDTRSEREAANLDANPDVRRLSANIVFPGFTAPKLAWMRTHEPEVFAKIAKVVLPAGFLNWHLAGTYVADMSDSAGTSWLNVADRAWSPELLAAGHMQIDQMPHLVEGSAVAGTLRPELAARWGLAENVTIAGGAADNAAAACGVGALGQGQGFVSLGTSGVLLVARDGCHPAPSSALHTFCHAVPDHWYQMGVMLAATDCLNWLASISGKTPADLTKALGTSLLPPGSVRFLPYLSGERTPHNDAAIRGSFTGLCADTNLVDMTRAVLEGVSFGLRESADAMTRTGSMITDLFVIGGGSKSDYWVQLLATILGVSLSVPKNGEFGAAMGAARLAQLASGQGNIDQVMTTPPVLRKTDPDLRLKPAFDAEYERFKAAYPAIRAIQ